MRDYNWIKLGDVDVSSDRNGKPHLDENGKIKSITVDQCSSIQVRIESKINPETKKTEYSLYISTLPWQMVGIGKFISGEKRD